MGSATDEEHHPDFGPGGYLPPRAAQRARKIVLRERMGLQWPIAAGVVAVVVAVVGAVFLVGGASPPEEPFVPVARLTTVQPDAVATATAGDTEVLLIRATGGVRAFVAPAATTPILCSRSGRLEAPGRVWTLDGRLVGGSRDGQSLSRLPATVYDGEVFVDPTARRPPPTPSDAGLVPRCTPA